MVVSVSVIYSHNHVVDRGLWLGVDAQHDQTIILQITNSGKEQISKSEVQFLPNVYHFPTIVKWKS